jgi:hypothetical protein
MYRNTVKLTCLAYIFYLATAGAAAQELIIRVESPDSTLGHLNQDIALEHELPGDWQLNLRGTDRMALGGGYTGLDQAKVENKWQLSSDASLALEIGRASTNWSPWLGNSVILSGQAPGMDQIHYTFQQGPASVEKIIGRLSGDDRYLLAHRLSLQVGPLTGSIGETVIASDQFANTLVTFLPWPYYWTEIIGLNTGSINNDEVNVNVFLQARYKNERGLMVGAELFVDDAPQQVGIRQLLQAAGQVRAEVPIGAQSKLSLQYARVNNYTYAFQVPFGDYTNRGYSLGSPYGPDNDELLVTYDFPRAFLGIDGVGLSLRRKGAGKFGDVWEKEGYDATRDRQFLSGVVEHTQVLFANAEYPITDAGELHVRFGVGPIQNAKNISGYNKLHPEGAIEFRYQLGR